MRINRYIEIIVHKRRPRDGWRRCMHCGKIATVTGWRRTGPTVKDSTCHPVRYCMDHAVQFGAVVVEQPSLSDYSRSHRPGEP